MIMQLVLCNARARLLHPVSYIAGDQGQPPTQTKAAHVLLQFLWHDLAMIAEGGEGRRGSSRGHL